MIGILNPHSSSNHLAQHNVTGQEGERLAAGYLLQKGYGLVHLNWRYGRLEVDIIASKNSVLHFIEVKTRTNIRFGHPEVFVNRTKLNHLILAAEQYLYRNPQWNRIQFDVLAVTFTRDQTDYFLLEDVFL